MTPPTGPRLYLDNGLTTTLGSKPLIGVVELRLESTNEMLTPGFLSRNLRHKRLLLLLQLLAVLGQCLPCFLDRLHLGLRGMTMLLQQFHALEYTVLKRGNALFPCGNLGKHSTVLFIGLDLMQLALGSGQLRLDTLQLALQRPPLPLGVCHLLLQVRQPLTCLSAGRLIGLQPLRQLLLGRFQGAQSIIQPL
jgi:hypothetical protein